ncbi:MAG: nuclease-related domain-containing protein [bacterium]
MSKSFGIPDNYALTVARKNLRYFVVLLVAITVIAHLAGFTAGLAITSPVVSYIPLTLLIVLLWVAKRRVSRILEDLQAAAIAFRKGADGMTLTADALTNLPDTYAVFHDVVHPSFEGNIDHVVVGPTGVFALETKDWRGMVTLASQGVLTLDGKHDQTPVVTTVLGLARNLKQKIEVLSSVDVFVQAVMVFPHASVHVMPGTRCNLAVQRLDSLVEYITNPVPFRQLTPQQTETITHDLQALFKLGLAQKSRPSLVAAESVS